MPGVNEPKYSKSEVSQRFNLKELLGYEPSDQQKKLFFEMVVDKMVQRTAEGDDINGATFKPYSKAYAEKKGVSRTSVDMILSGDMLSSFDDSQKQKNVVKIQLGSNQTKKGFNHCVGDTLPKRTFFGIKSIDDISSIVEKVDMEKEKTIGEDRLTLFDIRSLLSEIDIEVDS